MSAFNFSPSSDKSSKNDTISGKLTNSGIFKPYSLKSVLAAPIQLISLIIVGLHYSKI
jgi:hypothetical protein